MNDAPVAKDIKVWSRRGKTVSGVLQASDVDGDVVRYRLLQKPKRGTVTIDPATGRFTYTHGSSKRSDDDKFIYVASDGRVDSKPAKVTIDVREWDWDWGGWDWNDFDWDRWEDFDHWRARIDREDRDDRRDRDDRGGRDDRDDRDDRNGRRD